MEGMHTPKFDTSGILKELRYRLAGYIGTPMMRMAGPELEDFLKFEVGAALEDAYKEAEFRWQRDQINMQDQYSALMLKSVLAGAELGAKSEAKKHEEG